MATVTVIRGGETRRIHGEQGESLLSALQRAGLREPDAPCGGNGTCGKCLVEAEGALSEPAWPAPRKSWGTARCACL